MKVIICICAVIVAAVAIYFFAQDRAAREAYAKDEIWRRHEQTLRNWEKAYGYKLER